MDKLHPILCDLTVKNLNLSENDLNLLSKNVEVVFHSAASVRFDETLRQAVILNTRGTQEMLFLAEKMSKLKVQIKLIKSEKISPTTISGICVCINSFFKHKS